MGEEIEAAQAIDGDTSIPSLFASLPRWARTAIGAVLLAECALIAAGLARGSDSEPGFIRIELPGANPAPGFSTL